MSDRRVILVSHGPCEWDHSHTLMGQMDVPLGKDGWNQARIVGNRLASESIQRIYSSELDRAFATAQEIASHHTVSTQIDERLNDWNLGIWSGLTKKDLLQKYPDKYDDWKHDPWKTRMPQGETLESVWLRVGAFCQQRILTKPQTCLVVSHPWVCAMVKAVHGGQSLQEIDIQLFGHDINIHCEILQSDV